MLLNSANSIAATSQVLLSGGTLATGGFSQDFTTSAAPATLALTANSHLDLGVTGSSSVNFANSTGNTWAGTLTIDNWTYGSDHLSVGDGGLLGAQLSDIQFADFAKGASLISGSTSGAARADGEVTPLIGDVNGDGHVDVRDVTALLKALANPDTYRQERITGSVADGITASPSGVFTISDVQFALDIDGDGVDTNADIQSLLTYLISGNGSQSPVPEPGGFVLLAVGGLFLIGRHIRRQQQHI